MLGYYIPLRYILHERCSLSSCKPFPFGYDLEHCLSLLEREVVYLSLLAWSVATGEKDISCSWGSFQRHLFQAHAPTVVPERCAKRVQILTNRIVRMHAYPAAFGGFSDVWDCRLRHMQESYERVAVKAVRPVVANEKEFRVKKKAVEQELDVWAGLKHRNILPLYGIANGFGPFPAFVCPWAENGTLSEYLEKFEARLDMRKRLILLGDIAAGLQYLHSCKVVHGDLSGSNILITASGRACLSDFGLSTLIEQVSDTTVSGISFPGNIRWAAPELYGGCGESTRASQLSSPQADVYSFGSIMLQVLSGKLPFHGIVRDAQIVIMVSRGHQPPRARGWDDRDIPDELWEFIQACWASRSERPSSEEIVEFIGRQLSRL